ncbi:MAG: bifunctional phosphopantothenoylcysteine decarboxylase/phosphopantothenate--cysteine ligase CoaBC [Bacteroidota bacterium]|nr:bifunctional phosphopantothenoylcysteine decarboxylase/phosphopantothenate--cysteine ligase CoaBC [Bacteroidota bacterium]MDP4231847.1 bifunctional phosphopantothenoylcysteine decarboxylase/phosphopantothenate--cysteine ligase CoaBC [Bacteroidota bacterium]MDP4242733.1 bifunctional phosphopantothenoylcysteine decarboxylase/phosphopantothenate--cysteine ligase CoaBC [Bacteroidota bacterium]MDP4287184.1 bifunctional phosphopantothenoylcysteine decarboxylase/phosphopantothenate--cysteine ligase 
MTEALSGKRILLGVTGSIAAIKAPRIVTQLKQQGADVFCVLTENARQFISADELSEVSGNQTITQIFAGQPPADIVGDAPRLEKAGEHATWHVHLARSVDAMLIAPCSASMIGKLRSALYGDPVSLVAASLPRWTPLILVPAMDEDMWLQPAVQEALAWLRMHGALQIGPVKGRLASGLTGMGRMPEPEDIVSQFGSLLDAQPELLAGKHVLITGGPTFEPIDAVRFLGNRSSGKMAAALAMAAKRMGAKVTLIMGPNAISTDGIADRINIETANEMLLAVREQLPKADIIIMNAAVSDFAPEDVLTSKMKKRETDGDLAIRLKRTPDILSEIARSKRAEQIVVGFALEKGEGAGAYAKAKLAEKNLDAIVLNDIAEEGVGFGSDTNKVTIYLHNGAVQALPLLSKEACAKEILTVIARSRSSQ